VVDVVTGGSGFIGSHVVDKLVGEGRTVRVLDKVPPHRGGVEWLKGNLLSYEDLLEACADAEAVYHLAAIADVNVASTDPELCIRTNEVGTLKLMQAAAAKEVDRVILASSTWVYGKSNVPAKEDMLLPFPDGIYTKTKIGQEHIVTALARENSIPYTILRYDIPYGPRMRSNMAIATFVRRVLSKQPVFVFGDGNQGRCWIHVEDLASGNSMSSKNSAENQIINLAGAEFVTINEIVALLKERFGNILIERKPERPGDFRGVVTNIEKARSLISWAPKISFRDGLNRYVDWVLSQS
jgi:UDP-glucose 4-epimerase